MGCKVVAGGVGFLWVGLCFVVGKPLAARQFVWVGSRERFMLSPHVSPLSRLVAVSQSF